MVIRDKMKLFLPEPPFPPAGEEIMHADFILLLSVAGRESAHGETHSNLVFVNPLFGGFRSLQNRFLVWGLHCLPGLWLVGGDQASCWLVFILRVESRAPALRQAVSPLLFSELAFVCLKEPLGEVTAESSARE